MMHALQTQTERDVRLEYSLPPAIGWDVVIQGIFQHPFSTIRAIKVEYTNPATLDTPLFRQQLVITIAVILVQLLAGLATHAGEGFSVTSTLTGLGLQTLGQLLLWVFLTGGIALVGNIFEGRSRFGLLLTLTGASLIPWALTPVVQVVKTGMPLLGSLLFVGLWLWTTTLFLKAVMETFAWNLDRLIFALMLPGISLLWLGAMLFTLIVSMSH
jgi:hypothetical protein